MKKYSLIKTLVLTTMILGLAAITNAATCPDGLTVTISGDSVGCGPVYLIAAGHGGHGAFHYSWTGGTSTTTASDTFKTNGANPFTVTVTDDSGCTASALVHVTVNSIPTAAISVTGSGCSPIPLMGSGAGTGGTYAWTGGSNPNSATDNITASGTYTVTVTTSANCSASISTTQTVLATPSALITAGNTSFSFCTGSNLQLTAPSNGNALHFSNGYVSATGFNVGTGNFTVEAWIYPDTTTRGVIVAEGGINCTTGFALEFNNDTLILQTATSSGCQGTIAFKGLVTKQWQHVVASVSRGSSGNNTVLYIDGNPVATGNIPNGNLNSTSLTIGGSNTSGFNFNGAIDEVRIWNVALSQSAIVGSEYSIIPSNSPSLVNYYRFDEGTGTSTTDISGGVNGTLNGTVSWQTPSTSPVYENGGQTLLYNWSNGSTSQSTGVNAPGRYVVLVTNPSTSCFATDTVTVSLIASPVAHIDSVPPLCQGDTLKLNATGGSTYNWSGPSGFSSASSSPGVNNVSNANAGEYIVTVTGPTGCTASAFATVTVHLAPVALAFNSGPACNGSTLSLSASGGLNYAWSGPHSFHSQSQDTTLGSVTSAAAGTYTVKVTGVQGCTATASTSVTVNSAPTATASFTRNTICAGSALYFNSSGGVSYAWSGPNNYQSSDSTGSDSLAFANSAATGTYVVTVTDANGCTATASASATVNAPPVASAGNNSPICVGSTLGLTSNGGTSYTWSGPGFTSSAEDTNITNATVASTGTYTVIVTDANGCSASSSTAVTVNSPPVSPSASNSGPVCAGSSLSLFSSSADSYIWTGPNGFSSAQQSPVIGTAVNADSGTYNVTITTNGCSASTSTTASVIKSPVAAASNSTVGTQCAGENIYLSASGGGIYTWSGPLGFQRYLQNDTILAAGAAATGTYYVTVTDPNGCSATASTSLVVIDVPAVVIAGLVDTLCTGETLQLSADGGLTYSWSNPNGFTSNQQDTAIQHVTTADAGLYTVVATNAGGCSATASTNIVINTLPVITSCPGNMTVNETAGLCSAVVNFAVIATGSPTPGIWYSQNPGTVYPLGNTDVLVNAFNTCGSATCTFTITVVDNQPPVFTCPSNIAVLANEQTDTKTLTIPVPVVTDNCGVASLVNSFNGTSDASGTYPAGTTLVVWTATDVNGNTSTCTQTITIYPNLVLSGSATNTLCPGTFFGSVTTLVAGGQTPYAYLWSNGSTASGLSNLAAGNYTLTVTDAANNTVSETFTVETIIPNTAPAAPGAITGSAYVCSGGTAVYSIAAVPNTVSYTWLLNGNATITSGQGTTQITVKFATGFNNIKIQVASVNCVNSSNYNSNYGQAFQVNQITIPAKPANIQGPAYVCPATGSVYQYTATAGPGGPGGNGGPVTFTWTAPANATIISGQGTSTVGIKFLTGYTTGSVSVYASNCAGNSPALTLTVIVPTGAPAAMDDIDLYGNGGDAGDPAGVCPGDTVSYTVLNDNPAANVVSYNWIAPANSVIIAGQGTQVITIVYLPGYAGGNLVVSGANCSVNGASFSQSIPVNNQAPATPGNPTSVPGSSPPPPPPPPNQNTACPGDTLVYSINPVNSAHSYTWTVPANTTLIAGQGTTQVTFVVQPAFSGGNLSVYASNCAGNSAAAVQFINISNPPGNPGNVQGPNAVCPGIAYTYSANAASGEVNSYLWTVPANATIISGQGTTSIFVTYQNGFTSGTVSISAVNCIVSSNPSSIAVAMQTSAPGNFNNGDLVGATNHCIGDTVVYSVQWPNGATTFAWTTPAHTHIISGQGSTSILMRFDTLYTGGPLGVTASNCAGSASINVNLTHNNCGIHDPTGIDDNTATSGLDVLAYPNPFNGQFYLKVTGSSNAPVSMKVFDITGKMVEETENIPYQQEISAGSRLEAGVYLVQVKQGDDTKVVRIVKAE